MAPPSIRPRFFSDNLLYSPYEASDKNDDGVLDLEDSVTRTCTYRFKVSKPFDEVTTLKTYLSHEFYLSGKSPFERLTELDIKPAVKVPFFSDGLLNYVLEQEELYWQKQAFELLPGETPMTATLRNYVVNSQLTSDPLFEELVQGRYEDSVFNNKFTIDLSYVHSVMEVEEKVKEEINLFVEKNPQWSAEDILAFNVALGNRALLKYWMQAPSRSFDVSSPPAMEKVGIYFPTPLATKILASELKGEIPQP